MSDGVSTRAPTGRESARASARLGLTLRAVVLSPSLGFESALKAAARRERSQQRPAEGVFPYLLAGASGAAWFVLWLKVGGLLELRDAPEPTYRTSYLVASLLLGAVVGLLAQLVWSWLAARAAGISRNSLPRELRIVWGTAALPQILPLFLLLPLDLAIVGSQSFSTGALDDPVATAWAAASIALSTSFAVWSVYLLAKGVHVATDVGVVRSVIAAIVGVVVILSLFVPVVVYSAVA